MTEQAAKTEVAPDLTKIFIDEVHIQEFKTDGKDPEFLGKWIQKETIELSDTDPATAAQVTFDYVNDYRPNNTVSCLRIEYAGKKRYYQFHETAGLVPKLDFEMKEGKFALKEVWPYQSEVADESGAWIAPHVLPDGHLVPMCYVEPSLPGGFKMGDEDSPEKDRKTVEVAGGWMFMFPTTVQEWNWFCAHTGRTDAQETKIQRNGVELDVSRHPVTNVSFHKAMEYATWAGVGIPTEEEWERAARGNDGRVYPWGNEPPTDELCCSSIVAPRQGTDPVDAHPAGASPYGIQDMSGNVWEWTSTYF